MVLEKLSRVNALLMVLAALRFIKQGVLTFSAQCGVILVVVRLMLLELYTLAPDSYP